MSEMTPIALPAQEIWNDATTQVNGWRGEAIHWFSRVEVAVSEALWAAHRTDRLTGARFKALAALLADHTDGEKASTALETFAPLLEKRIALCHGSAKIALDRNGHWLVRLKWLELGKQPTTHEAVWIKAEAAVFLLNLKKRGTALLRALDRLAANPAPASTSR